MSKRQKDLDQCGGMRLSGFIPTVFLQTVVFFVIYLFLVSQVSSYLKYQMLESRSLKREHKNDQSLTFLWVQLRIHVEREFTY